MKSKSKSNQLVSAICILSMMDGMMVHSPIAHADEFGDVCATIVEQVKKGEKKEGDNKAGKCVEADLAGKSAEWTLYKSVIQLTAAAYTSYLYTMEKIGKNQVRKGAQLVIEGNAMSPIGIEKITEGGILISSGAAKITKARTACPITALAAGAGVMAVDMTGKYKINQVKSQYGQKQESLFDSSMLISMGVPLAASLMGDKSGMKIPELITKKEEFVNVAKGICNATEPCTDKIGMISPELSKEKLDAELDKKSGCLGTSLMMGAMGAYSLVEKSNFEDARKYNVELAKKITIDSGTATTSVSVSNSQPDDKKTFKSPSHAAYSEIAACDKTTGDASLNCMVRQFPETAAITNSRLKNEIENHIGKNLGDFARGFKGKTDSELAQYVAGATGVSAGALESFLKDSKNSIRKSGGGPLTLANVDLGSGSGFSRSGGSLSLSKSKGMDFDFSKMMSGLLGNLNGNGSDTEKKDSPAEAVFRRMDLLPAEQIQANKDISLFARIAYRYRKKSDKLDPTLKSDLERTISSEKK